jgi:hypothetical protein
VRRRCDAGQVIRRRGGESTSLKDLGEQTA